MRFLSILSAAAVLGSAAAWNNQPIDHVYPIQYNYPDVNCLDHIPIGFNQTLSGGRTVFNANITITGFSLAPNNNSLLVDGYLFYRAYVGGECRVHPSRNAGKRFCSLFLPRFHTLLFPSAGPLIRQTFTDIPANLTGDFSPYFAESRRLADVPLDTEGALLGNSQTFTKPQDAKGPSSASLFPDIAMYNEAKESFARRSRELLFLIDNTLPVCPTLYLDLGPIPLDLLGVDVDPSPFIIDCGKLVGTCSTIHDLLCAVARLLFCRQEEGPTFPFPVPETV